jgi:hypothetical protein
MLSRMQNSDKLKEFTNTTMPSDDELNAVVDVINKNLASIFLQVFEVFRKENTVFFNQLSQKDLMLYLALLILFLVVLVFGYLFYVFPKAEEVRNKVLMTIRLLNMIPPHIISGTASIRNYLNSISI